MTHTPQWKLPAGVTRGLWEYANTDFIAQDYDNCFAYHRLFELDSRILEKQFKKPGVIADFGCGTGRALVPLVRRGFRGLAIDLSTWMLAEVTKKARKEQLPIDCLRANLVDLDCLADATVDYGICLFSTLGMIRGRVNRQQALTHFRRVVRTSGCFIIHAHNFWFNLFDPGGPWWVLKNLVQSAARSKQERGDKFFFYRGVPQMFLHVFTRRELQRDLVMAGFAKQEWIPLNTTRNEPLQYPWLCSSLRANGWIVVCH